MKPETPEKTGRDGNACTAQPCRMIRIHHPGKDSDLRTKRASASVVGPTGEQGAAGIMPPPEPPERDGGSVPAVPTGPDHGISRTPAGAEAPGTCSHGGPEDHRAGIPEGAGDRRAKSPAGTGTTGPQVPAENGHSRTGQPLPGTAVGRSAITRGHPPYVAISEAERKAKARGLMVFSLEPGGDLPFHFVICDRDCISLVRVRRLKYPGYTVAEIECSCKNDIAALRAVPVTQEIFRELWVRGPDRHWYRYLVLPGSVEILEDGDEPEDNDRQEGGTIPPSSLLSGSSPSKDRAGISLPAITPGLNGACHVPVLIPGCSLTSGPPLV